MKELEQLKEMDRLGFTMRLAAEEWRVPWKTLIAIILSARTRDEKTIPVAHMFFRKYKTLQKLACARLNRLRKILRPINFYKTKSKNVLGCAKMLVKDYNGRVPTEFELLIKLPGVGRKTANVFLSEMGADAIAVDTHVAYISQKLGWTINKDPKKIEEDLKKLFPSKYWKRINPILVRFGKTYTSRKRKDEILGRLKKLT